MSLADGARRTLVERFATDELRENYGLRLFPPVLVGLMLSLDELNPVKIFCAYTGVEVEVVFVALVGALLTLRCAGRGLTSRRTSGCKGFDMVEVEEDLDVAMADHCSMSCRRSIALDGAAKPGVERPRQGGHCTRAASLNDATLHVW